jgi:hypothetical protein
MQGEVFDPGSSADQDESSGLVSLNKALQRTGLWVEQRAPHGARS